MSVADVVAARGIGEVVHFTTNHGCLGTLYTNTLLSRARLQDDEMVKYLFAPNAELRRDRAYLDHVSLSIGHINKKFFDTSSNSWHRHEPIFWCILSFNPNVLSDDGVEFATTNNMYTSVRRNFGEDGLNALYADSIELWTGNVIRRPAELPAKFTTCPQAEALYPRAVSTEHLERIYVRNATEQSEVIGFLKASFHRDVDVLVSPEKFGIRQV